VKKLLKKKFGKEKIIVYRKNVNILEHEIPHFSNPDELLQGFCKLVCLKKDNDDDDGDEQVIGFHYVGPNAGEITQLSSLAIKLKATKEDFDNTVGIHPTVCENFTKLEFGVTEDTGC